MRSADRTSTQHPGSVAPTGDYSEICRIQSDMDKLREQMAEEVESYGKARAILEFSSERRKEALSDAFCAIQATDPEASASSLEHRARNSKGYKARIESLLGAEMTAQTARACYELMQVRLDVLRSNLAIERAKLEIL